MKNRFVNKVVIVTGASSGIGEAIAREFARNGSKVVLAARSEESLAKIVSQIISDGFEASYIKTDVSIEEECRKMVEFTVNKYGTVDILINNAGISMRALFTEVDLSVLASFNECKFLGNSSLYKICFAISDCKQRFSGGNIIRCRFSWSARKNRIFRLQVCNSWFSGNNKNRESEKEVACNDHCSGIHINRDKETCSYCKRRGAGRIAQR